MLLMTGYLAIRSHSRELARVRFRDGLEAGQRALAEDDLAAARSHFALAVAAVDTLGTEDPKSNLVRQLHREIIAMTSLAPGSLFEMLHEAEQAQNNRGVVTWENIFRSRYQGSWFVLQSPVKRTEDSYELELPITIGEHRRRISVQADLPDFSRVSTEEGVTDVLFAAPVIGCELNDAKDAWIIRLDGEAGFLWSHLDNLRRLGFIDAAGIDEEEVTNLLMTQTQLLEESL